MEKIKIVEYWACFNETHTNVCMYIEEFTLIDVITLLYKYGQI